MKDREKKQNVTATGMTWIIKNDLALTTDYKPNEYIIKVYSTTHRKNNNKMEEKKEKKCLHFLKSDYIEIALSTVEDFYNK